MFIGCECCVLSGRGLCDELITGLGESYRLWCLVVCDLETSYMRKRLAHWGLSRQKKKKSHSACREGIEGGGVVSGIKTVAVVTVGTAICCINFFCYVLQLQSAVFRHCISMCLRYSEYNANFLINFGLPGRFA
jgi:hypothetical protein